MTTSTTKAHPLLTLREHITALEAAVTLCLADPSAKPVHRLRTTTRRIEGQLAMLSVLPGIPRHKKEAGEARKVLKKLRRAGGVVRDLDVQIHLIEGIVAGRRLRQLKDDSAKLCKDLEEERKQAAQKLARILKKKQKDLALTLVDLLNALKASENYSLPATELVSITQSWFSNNVPPEPKDSLENPEYLHGVRKVAKLARYIAENAPKQARTPRRLAASFETLQESGGQWHDWMVLAEIAKKKLGGSSPLTKALERHNVASLRAYRKHLREML
ncbi:MAG TPA: CHAD domain-containing protein [Edaphobacter sp.]|nr:CHAD domain-containing protein [Edaphobacter sp.]